ncbi:hypothetical protein F5051DRAFT_341736 [Lentinula edodes]|nr:hypothetical protein F5051DRAFT_341736 [Lentinula edodes]
MFHIGVATQYSPRMIELQEALASYEEDEIANNPPREMPPAENFTNATVACQAVISQEKEVENITRASPTSKFGSTPEEIFLKSVPGQYSILDS